MKDPAECWTWTGARSRSVNPIYRINGNNLSARKLVYEVIFGTSFNGIMKNVCGNRLCVNPHHSKMKRVLTEQDKQSICERWARHLSFTIKKTDLAREYGVTRQYIDLVLKQAERRSVKTLAKE